MIFAAYDVWALFHAKFSKKTLVNSMYIMFAVGITLGGFATLRYEWAPFCGFILTGIFAVYAVVSRYREKKKIKKYGGNL